MGSITCRHLVAQNLHCEFCRAGIQCRAMNQQSRRLVDHNENVIVMDDLKWAISQRSVTV